MAKAGFLAKKSGFMMMETETSNGYGSDKGSALRNFDGLGLQPTSTTSCCASYKSPVGMAAAAACLRYPFTTAQWQELERQALIFKYMMASVPVPPHLLIPTTNLSSVSASSLSRGWFANGDPEPGRCKRTDGKKWRCSRDAAPDQKYCERHMHRSRPRSRKHVEVHTDNTTIPRSSSELGSSTRPYPPPKPDFKSLPMETLGSAPPYKDPRFMDWMLKGENAPMLGQDLQHLMDDAPQGSSARGASLYQQSCYQENRSLNLYTDFAQAQGDECCLYLNPEMDPSDQRQMPRHFIDAWSNARHGSSSSSPRGGTSKSSVGCNNEKLSPSTLSLSMSGDNGAGEDMDQIQMGLGVMDSECDNKPPQALSWMTPASWVGGPLGEVLQSSNTISQSGSRPVSPRKRSSGGGINFMTDDWGGSSRHTSPRGGGTAMSGVLHKSLTSPSDSPTYKTAGKTEVFLRWMNQNK